MGTPPREPNRALPAIPSAFRLGTATSAAQIEGAATRDGRGRSIWDAFAARPGTILDGTDPSVACDHLARLDEDLDLVADLGADVYRFSIAWPRVQPNGRGAPLTAGLDVYDRITDGCLARGIEPWPTLYHWDLPASLQDDLGGWAHRDVAGRFADYAAIVAERLGDRIPRWSTLNEPWCSAWLGHERGVHAPGVRDEASAVRAAHHLLLGHGMATQALRATTEGDVGIVVNLSPVRPQTDAPGDLDAAERTHVMQNTYWLGALAGATPEAATAAFRAVVDLEDLVRDGDEATIATAIDWLGVNYYGPQVARAGDNGPRPAGPGLDGIELVPSGADEPGNMLGWHIDAGGLEEVLQLAARMLPGVALAVTENGIPLPDRTDGGPPEDAARIAYVQDHIAATLTARAAGVPVDTHLVWSLLDNFEWAEGYGPRFGLVHVDFETQERTPKASYAWLREVARSR